MSYMRKCRNRNCLLNNLLDEKLEKAPVIDTKIIDDFSNNPFKLRKCNITISEYSVSQHIHINNVTGENENVTNNIPVQEISEIAEENGALFKSSLVQEISSWATRNRSTRVSLNEILSIFIKIGHEKDFPKDSLCLLHTPCIVNVLQTCGGQYAYLGFLKGIKQIFFENKHVLFSDKIALEVNIDGVPLFKSKSTQLWPILCKFDCNRPFILAVFCGDKNQIVLPIICNNFLMNMKIYVKMDFNIMKEVIQLL